MWKSLPVLLAVRRTVTSSARAGAVAVFLLVVVVYVLSPTVTNGDSYLSFPTAVSMVHERDLDLDEFRSPLVHEHYGINEVDGREFDVYPWPVAIGFVPVVLAADAAHVVGIGPGAAEFVERDRMGPLQLVAASIVTALSAALVFLLVRRRTRWSGDRQVGVALLVALGYAFGTAAWTTSSRALWQHGPSMALGAGILLLATAAATRRNLFVLGVLTGTIYAVRPTNSLVVVAVAAWCLWTYRTRLGMFLWYVGGGALVAVVWGGVNLASYGDLLPEYYRAGRLGFGDYYAEALAANLVSPARGLLVFSPIVVLSVAGVVVARRERRLDGLHVTCAAIAVGYWLVVSANAEGWWAGHSIGPRLLADPLPMLALLAVPAVDRLLDPSRQRARTAAHVAAAVLLGWSVVVNAGGAVLRSTVCWNVEPTDVNLEPGRVWSISRPQVLYGVVAVTDRSLRRTVLGPCEEVAATAPRPIG